MSRDPRKDRARKRRLRRREKDRERRRDAALNAAIRSLMLEWRAMAEVATVPVGCILSSTPPGSRSRLRNWYSLSCSHPDYVG